MPRVEIRHGLRYRRRKLEDGEVEETYEVPCSVIHTVGLAWIKERIAGTKRHKARTALAKDNKEQVRRWLAAGETRTEFMAEELGLSRSRIREIKRLLNYKESK